MYEAATIPELYAQLVPEYRSRVFPRPFIARVAQYEDRYGERIARINPKRALNRIAAYIDPQELQRIAPRIQAGKDASLRFGVAKTGRGYHGDRGDFCLVGGAIEKRDLTLFYRSLEMIGGFGYDLTVINQLSTWLGVEWRAVTFCAARANIFALKRNSNEALYPKLLRAFRL